MKNTFLILLFLTYFSAFTQSTADYTVFNYSLNLANPAFAGKNGKTQIITNYKKIWAGVENSLNVSAISFSTSFNNGIGLGVNVIHDDLYLYNETITSLDLSYGVKLDDNNDLLFGLKAQGAFFNANFNRITTQIANDPLFTSDNNSFRPNFSIGMVIRNENYFAHLAFLDVLKNNRFNADSKLLNNTNSFRVNTGGGYYADLNDKMSLTSTLLVRFIEGTPLSFDLTSMAQFYEKFNVGFTYRWNNAMMGNILIDTTPWMQIGYSYGLSINDLIKYNNGTHEFFLRIHFDKKNTKNNFKWRLSCF